MLLYLYTDFLLIYVEGIHAREWISVAVSTYIINELIKENSDEDFKEKLNFHVLPIANPDGYIYTWSNVSNIRIRLWRGNRHTNWNDWSANDVPGNMTPSNPNCFGVDLNRNFGFHWNGILI